jgi:hypothetical protein
MLQPDLRPRREEAPLERMPEWYGRRRGSDPTFAGSPLAIMPRARAVPLRVPHRGVRCGIAAEIGSVVAYDLPLSLGRLGASVLALRPSPVGPGFLGDLPAERVAAPAHIDDRRCRDGTADIGADVAW